jgi:hypothetical protein
MATGATCSGLPGATITAAHEASGQTAVAVADDTGRFHLRHRTPISPLRKKKDWDRNGGLSTRLLMCSLDGWEGRSQLKQERKTWLQ